MTLFGIFRHGIPTLAAMMTVVAAAVVTAQPVTRASAQTPTQAAALAAKAGLVGTWVLVRYENTDAKGKFEQPFGVHPRGYFVYDATGHVNIQIARNPPLPNPATDEDAKTQLRDGIVSYLAYFGTYRLDLEAQTVTHVVEGSLMPSYRDTEQVRPFKLEGDMLVTATTMPDGSKYFRELRRVK